MEVALAEQGPAPVETLRRIQWAAVAFTFVLPVLVFPGLEHPFSSPKLAVWGVVCGAGVLAAACRGTFHRAGLPTAAQITLIAWLGALGASAAFGEFASLPALLLPVLGVTWCVLLIVIRPKATSVALALALSGAVVATLALLQFAGLDLFALAGWIPSAAGNSRMRVFGTLGNPDFVAAFLVAVTPLTYALQEVFPARRRLILVAVAADVLGVIATGSRAPVLAFLVMLAWVTWFWRARGWGWLSAAVGMAAVCVVVFSSARPLSVTLRGRAYIWQVAAPHLAEHPLLGSGPGTFVGKYPEWEDDRWRADRGTENLRAFAGPQDHAHNDYLEFALENGGVGLAGFLALVAIFLLPSFRRAKSAPTPLLTGATTGAAALLATALVDFPLHRPTEVFVFWSLLAIAHLAAISHSHSWAQPSLQRSKGG